MESLGGVPVSSPNANWSSLSTEYYRGHPAARFWVGDSEELLYLVLKKEARLLGHTEATLLNLCSNFASLGAHADRIAKSVPPGIADSRAILEGLHQLVANGLVLTPSELMTK